jgi:hypothetical protein
VKKQEVTNNQKLFINKVDGSVTSEPLQKKIKYIYPLSYFGKSSKPHLGNTPLITQKRYYNRTSMGEMFTVEGPIEYHESSTPSDNIIKKSETGIWN